MITTVSDPDERDLTLTEPEAPTSSAEDLVVRLVREGRGAYDLVWRGSNDDDDSSTNTLLLGIPGAGFVAVEIVDGPLADADGPFAVARARCAAERLRDLLSQQERSSRCSEVRWAHAVIAPESEAPTDDALLGRHELDFLIERLVQLTLASHVTGRAATDEDVVAAAEALQAATTTG